MTALYDSLRAANLAVSLLLAAAMLARGAAFLRAPVDSKYGRLALFAWVTSTAYGTGEAMAQTPPAGPRVPTVTSVLCITAAWVWAEIRSTTGGSGRGSPGSYAFTLRAAAMATVFSSAVTLARACRAAASADSTCP
jgi:hypothetical protein